MIAAPQRRRVMVDRPGPESGPAPRLAARTKRIPLPVLPGTSWREDVEAIRAWVAAAKADPAVDPYWVDDAIRPLQESLIARGARSAYPRTPAATATSTRPPATPPARPAPAVQLVDVDQLGRRDWCHLGTPASVGANRHRIGSARFWHTMRAQDGVCAICRQGQIVNGAPAPLYVDHDHACCPDTVRRGGSCGRCFRGLLCSGCNSGMVAQLDRCPDWSPIGAMSDGLAEQYARARAYLGLPPLDPARATLAEQLAEPCTTSWGPRTCPTGPRYGKTRHVCRARRADPHVCTCDGCRWPTSAAELDHRAERAARVVDQVTRRAKLRGRRGPNGQFAARTSAGDVR